MPQLPCCLSGLQVVFHRNNDLHSTFFPLPIQAGHPVTVEVGSTLADGLAVPRVGPIAYEIAHTRVDKVVVLQEKVGDAAPRRPRSLSYKTW